MVECGEYGGRENRVREELLFRVSERKRREWLLHYICPFVGALFSIFQII
jgi:hypothetical protein